MTATTVTSANAGDPARKARPHTVAVLVRQGVLPMELGLVHQLFGLARSPEGEPLYSVLTCTVAPGPVRTDADFAIHVDRGPQTLAEADTVVIPATHELDETETEGRLPAPLAEALALLRPGTRLASICTGSFVLAAAGLLDGRTATTHWRSVDRFRQLYPRVDVDPDVLYTDDGDVLTSAGEASGIDLCLHLIRRDHGSAVAAHVARATVVPPHREGGQAQFIRCPITPDPVSSTTGTARAWALRNLDRTITLADLAAQEAVSVRTFNRRFRDETGQTPIGWLNQQRIDHARELLESTDLSIDRVAAKSGFGTATSLRQQLRAAVGVSPRAYRATFRGGGAI